MMDYSIGSVADFISGSVTPNKPKVFKKHFKMGKKVASTEQNVSPNRKENTEFIQIKNKPAKSLKTNKRKSIDKNVDVGSPKQKKQKRNNSPKKLKEQKVKVFFGNEEIDNSAESSSDLEVPLMRLGNKDCKVIFRNSNNSDEDEEIDKMDSKKFNYTGQNKLDSEESYTTDDEINSEKSDNTDEEKDDIPTKRLKQNSKFSLKLTKPVDDSEKSDLDEEAEKESDSCDSEDDESKGENPKHTKTEMKKNPNHITIFVGNLPVSVTQHKLKKIFSKFGNVVNARIRSIPVADPKIPKKVAAIKKQFHPNRKSLHGYVTFLGRESAGKALALNGTEYKDHHLRVNICDEAPTPDRTKAIFLGNVSFDAEEEELWKLFQSCGEIESVRLVRDRKTDVGKGFGYINFKTADSVELALQMGEVKLRDRILRISLYNNRAPKKANPQKPNQKGKIFNKGKRDSGMENTATNGQFQGKVATQKKKKFHKANQQKKNLAKKVAPRTMSS